MTGKHEPITGIGKRNALDITADRAIEIYERKYKDDFEKRHKGKFVVIDVHSEEAYIHESSAGAYQEARNVTPVGLFYMLRVGSAHTLGL